MTCLRPNVPSLPSRFPEFPALYLIVQTEFRQKSRRCQLRLHLLWLSAVRENPQVSTGWKENYCSCGQVNKSDRESGETKQRRREKACFMINERQCFKENTLTVAVLLFLQRFTFKPDNYHHRASSFPGMMKISRWKQYDWLVITTYYNSTNSVSSQGIFTSLIGASESKAKSIFICKFYSLL